MTQQEIDAMAEKIRASGVPDSLNRWIGMTPESLAESEAKIARQSASYRNKGETNMPAPTTKADGLRQMREAKAGKTPAPGPAKKAAKTVTKKVEPPAAKPKVAKKKVAKTDAGSATRGTKMEIVRGLLARKNGCTAKDVMAACEWPSVSMPQQAKSLGVTLHKQKTEGSPTRYADHPLA